MHWRIPLPLAALAAAAWAANPNLPLDRPYTMLNPAPALLESEYARQIANGVPQSFIFPRPCVSRLDSSRACTQAGGWAYADSAMRRELFVSPIGGYEYRYLGSNVHASDFGILIQGGSGPLSFYLDARMFVEEYDDLYHASYDREFVERQDEDASGSVAYTSYSRYRSNLSYDLDWGRISVARDAVHWGPGLFSNLAFQQDAIPFNQLSFTSHLGPLSVQTLYGQLATSGDWEFDTSSQAKSLYAHRYEWRAGGNLLLGVSEQLILYKVSAPFAFVPVIPLFITKASEKERLNNGNIAADASYRLPGLGRIYTEFLVDDIQSPTSLFGPTWSNKWAWMAGLQAIRDIGALRSGAILEYSRVEPWVYTHYVPHTAQTSNQDYPLGNPQGPNSQWIVAKSYLERPGRWYTSARFDLVWKGSDPGSAIEDIHRDTGDKGKEFLFDVRSPAVRFEPYAWYGGRRYGIYARAVLGDSLSAAAGIQFRY
jgi:hypothetical protein